MKIASMTGFGRATAEADGIEATVEIRSFNNRYCEIVSRLPKVLMNREEQIKGFVRKLISRGRVNVSLTLRNREDQLLGLQLNHDLAQAYAKMLGELKEKVGVKGDVTIDHLLVFEDIFSAEEDEGAVEDSWSVASKAINEAVQNLVSMRLEEGEQLALDLLERIQALGKSLDKIEALSSERADRERERLRSRIHSLVEEGNVDEGRIEMEIALLADKMDVTEECVRFRSHNKLFTEYLNKGGAIGRKLTFLLQEMNREVNTIGAKANDADISHLVVDIKEEVEKLREQVQNIE